MTPDNFLNGLRNEMTPSSNMKARIGKSIQERIAAESPLFADLKKAVTPKKAKQAAVWNRISSHVELPQADAFQRIRIALQPSSELKEQIKERVMRSLEPVRLGVSFWSQTLKWSAAFALVALVVRTSPFFFMASSTVAESAAMLIPTRGEVAVSIGGMWQTVEGEIALEPGMMIRTHDGEASIILHDDGVLRMDELTTLEIHDLTDRLEPSSVLMPTATLYTGQIWVQGLVPQQLPGIIISTTYGQILVNEGSVSIAEDDYVDVDVYDRSAMVDNSGSPVFLASGERTQLSEDDVLLVKKIPAKWYQYTWADQNLQRDAVHRHDIAQMQHERRIARAGILPTSPLYPVKRFAEIADVWMTFGEQTRVEKQIQFAETRLNEAAALIYEGQEANITLDEYKQTLAEIAEGQNNGSLAEYLVQRAIVNSTAQMAATLPGDESYAIKKTVLQTGQDIASVEEAHGTLLLDGLAVMLKAADEGRTDLVRGVWSDLQPYMLALESEEIALDPLMHKEAQTLLSFLASALHTASSRGADIDPELLDDIAAYLPVPLESQVVVLSEEEVMHIVQSIRDKIFLYNMTQSRINQFIAEIKALDGHPDQGRILRRLAAVLPEGPENFPDRVYKEIVRLRWERASEEII